MPTNLHPRTLEPSFFGGGVGGDSQKRKLGTQFKQLKNGKQNPWQNCNMIMAAMTKIKSEPRHKYYLRKKKLP